MENDSGATKQLGQSTAFIKQRTAKAISNSIGPLRIFTLPHKGTANQQVMTKVKVLNVI